MNWGAFAGGLAQGIEKQQELALKKKQLEEEANNQIIKRQAETEKMLAESEKQKTDFMTKYTDKVLEYETKIADAKDTDEMNSQINALNNYKKISRTMAEKLFQADGQNQDNIVNSLNFDFLPKVTNYTIKDVSGNDTTVTLPEGLQAEQLRLMENGNIGQVVVNQQGKEAGVNATTITPIKFKTEKKSGQIAVVNGSSGWYSDEQLEKLTQQGAKVEKPITSKSTSTTNVTVEAQKQQTTDEVFSYIERVKSGTVQYNPAEANKLEARTMSTDYGKSDLVKQLRNDVRLSEISLSSLERLQQDIQSKVDSKDYENMYKTYAQGLIAKYVPDNFDTLNPEDKEKTYSWLRTQGTMGDAMAQYLKSNSGLAASEKEAMRNVTNMFGTGSKVANVSAINNSLKGFIENKKATLLDMGNQALDAGLPSTGGRILNKYGKKTTNEPTMEQPKSTVKPDFNTAFQQIKNDERGKNMTDEDIERYLKTKGITK